MEKKLKTKGFKAVGFGSMRRGIEYKGGRNTVGNDAPIILYENDWMAK